MAAKESFVVQYWHNDIAPSNQSLSTVSMPERNVAGTVNDPPWANGRGNENNGITDDRGEIYLWGSVVQRHRGYMLRNPQSPYGNATVGMDKNYHYDQNLFCNPPPFYPECLPKCDNEVSATITSFRNID